LEKIEMKKTLVAVAAMAAVTGAMADAKLYGTLDQAAVSIGLTSATGVKTTTKSFGEDLNGVSELGVKGSEDLGNGLTATYGVNLSYGLSTSANTPAIYNGSGIGVKGEFGAVSIGTSYNLNFFTNAAADPTGFGGNIGQLNNSAGGLKGNLLSYTAPQFVPGLSLAAEIQRGETSASSAGNATGYMAQYDTGGLMVRYSNSSKTEAANVVTTTTSTVGAAVTTSTYTSSNQLTASSIGGTATALSARTALDKTKTTAVAVTYDFGMAKVFYGASTIKAGTTVAQIKTSTTGISVPFGAIGVGYAVSSEKGTSDGTGRLTTANTVNTLVSGNTVESTANRLFVTYSLSKRTTLYGMSGKASVDTIASAASKLKTTITSVGIKHGF
jgi:predicted porin